jgi:hypothetical protein
MAAGWPAIPAWLAFMAYRGVSYGVAGAIVFASYLAMAGIETAYNAAGWLAGSVSISASSAARVIFSY